MIFQYVAYDKDGDISRGRLAASSEAAASELLGHSGYRVVTLTPKEVSRHFSLSGLTRRFSGRLRPTAVILFYRQLAMLLGSGVDVIASLEMLQGQTTSRQLATVLSAVISDVRGGSRLYAAMNKHPSAFSEMSCRMLRIGEESGNFEVVLTHLADYIEKELVAAKGVKGALMYPVIAIIATVGVVVVLIGFVFPAFGELYSSMGADLPSSTQMLIDLGTAMRANGVYMLMGVVVAVLAAVFYFRTPAGKLRRDALALKLPVIGRISHVKQLARAGRSIALLFKAGLPMTDIIRLTGEAAGNRVLRQSFVDVEQDMLRGGGLSGPMAKNPLFLPLMVQMVKIGEETGNLDTNLEAVAENYEIEADDKIRMMTAMIQPAMTIVIGGIVGLLALSLTTAMYSIYGQGI